MAFTNILCQIKRWFAFSKVGFCADIKVFKEAPNAVKFLDWLRKFGLAQNIFGPVKVQFQLPRFKKNIHIYHANLLLSFWHLVRALQRFGSGHKSNGVCPFLFFMYNSAPFATRKQAMDAELFLSPKTKKTKLLLIFC